MLAAPFVVDGVDAVRRPHDHVERFENATAALERLGLTIPVEPKLLTRLSGALTIGAGLMLATNRAPRAAALTLFLVNVPVTLVNNPVWAATGPEQRQRYAQGLLRGAGLAGGLVLAAADREGRPSFGWRLANAQEQRARLKETRAALKARYADRPRRVAR